MIAATMTGSIAASPPVLAGICFDAFGSLFDLSPLLAEIDQLAGDGAGAAFQQRAVTWTWHATASGRWRAFDVIARHALTACAVERSVRLSGEQLDTLVSRLVRLPLAEGALEAVRALAPAQLAVLSNGSREGVSALVHNAGIAQQVVHLLGADEVQLYKPAPQVYALPSMAFGVSSDRVLLVSANDWDVAGAAMAGLRTAWIAKGRPETRVLGIGADVVVDSLADLPDALADRGLIDFEPGGTTIPGRPHPPGTEYAGQDKVVADTFPASDPPAY
jgi:2-haloacid dehalogenase